MGDAATTKAYEEIVGLLNHQQVIAFTNDVKVLSAMLVLYEIIITLHIEIDHIWTKKWSFFTCLYILQRYLPLFDTAGLLVHNQFTTNMSVRYCTSTFNVATWSFIIGSMLSEILTIRLWAVWERSFWVGIGLVGFFFACWVPCCVFMASFLGAVKFGTPPIPDFWGCFIVGGSEIIYMCWVLIMVYDTGTLVMILIPGVAAYRRGGRSQLSKTIYQDGVMYYALLSFCAMINVIIVFTLPHDLRLLLASFERVLHSIVASRAILHIRQVASERSTYRTMSDIEFSRNGQENEHGTLPSLQSSDGSLAVG